MTHTPITPIPFHPCLLSPSLFTSLLLPFFPNMGWGVELAQVWGSWGSLGLQPWVEDKLPVKDWEEASRAGADTLCVGGRGGGGRGRQGQKLRKSH